MPPQGKKHGSASAAAAAERAKDLQETEDPLQAVVLLDSFEGRFAPLTLETPRCLLPLANTPLVEYTLEYLAREGVDEVYLYCAEHNEDAIETYLAASKWASARRSFSPFKTVELIKSASHSIGDAMRDLDKRGIMGSDFIVIYGDVVSNVRLQPVLAEHRARREKDKNAIMTMVLREVDGPKQYRAHLQGSVAPVFVIDPGKKRCLHYEQVAPASSQPRHRRVEIDAELILTHQELDVREDLIDGGIDICTPDVLALWSDNFDYEAPRRGFLHSVLKDYELNGKTIHTFVERDYYTARVRNLRAYAAVTRDVLSRWSYPFTPDANLYGDQQYRYHKGNVFREDGVKEARQSKVGPHTLLGSGVRLADGAHVAGSVLGRGCVVGKDCIVQDSYLFENVVLGDGTHVKNSILASGVVVGKNAKIHNGAIVSYNVKLGDSVVVDKSRRLTRVSKSGAAAQQKNDTGLVGIGGEGHEFDDSESEDEAEGGADLEAEGLQHPFYSTPYLHSAHARSADSISTLHSADGFSSEDGDGGYDEHGDAISIASSRGSSGAADDSASGSGFLNDATSSLYDSLQKGHDVSTMQLELQGLRLSANASEHQVRRAVVGAFVRHILDTRKRDKKTTIKQLLQPNMLIIQRTLFDKDEDDQKPDQVDFLLLVQSELARRADVSEANLVLLNMCNNLYLLDVIDQEGFEGWWADPRATASEELKTVRKSTQDFMTTLTAEDSEEDDDDDDEEDDSD